MTERPGQSRPPGDRPAVEPALGAELPEPAAAVTREVRAGAPTSLTSRVVSGAHWSTLSRLLVQGLQFAVGLVLARLLLPEQFGLMASVLVISNFGVLFFELGLGAALVQRPRPSEEEKSTVFWVNVLGGVLFAGLLLAAGPAVAAFYGEPELRWLTPLAGLAFTLSFGVVHNALLQRELRFKAIALVELGAAVAGHVATIAAALAGAGAYALAVGPLVTSLLISVAAVALVRWRPRSFISMPALRALWRFSGGLLGFNVVNYWGRNADNLLIGRVLGAAPLGYYNRAYSLMLLPVTQVTQALGRVMFPALAAMGEDRARVRWAYLRSVRIVNAVTVPVLLGLVATAEGLVPLLWGDQWTATVPILQVLCLAGVPQCLSSSVGWIYQSQGQTGLMFRMGVLGTVVGVVAIVVGLQWGVLGVAWGVLARYWLMMPLGLHVAGRLIDLKARTVLASALPVTLAAALMAGVAWAWPLLLDADREAVRTVIGQVMAGVAVYTVVIVLTGRALLGDLATVLLTRRRG